MSPGIGFGEYGDGFVRMAVVENKHRLRQAVRCIRTFMQRHGTQPAAPSRELEVA